MAGPSVAAYADEFEASLRRSLGGAAPDVQLAALATAAAAVDAVAASPSPTAAEWQAAVAGWTAARDQLAGHLRRYLLDGLPDLPGLGALAGAVGWSSPEGLHGEIELGPLRLALASSSLTVQPTASGSTLPALLAGPFQPLGIAASIRPPFGDGGLPGGGSVMRLPGGVGYGGTLHIPLGAVSADASAVLERLPDGTPAFLAVIGVEFLPPIQLSFGFSLDRVGGIVGVNRAMDPDALAHAIRSGAAGNALFAAGPPASPAALIETLRQLFPSVAGRHVVGPMLRLSWLSLGAGSLVALDLGVVVELPTGRVAILGVARAQIPGAAGLIQLRLDVLGLLDPPQSLASVDASLVDSHALGIFSVYGDAAMRLSWGSQAYTVVSIGGFYPGFNPEPAKLPALRRVGMATDLPVPGLSIRAEGYLAVTTNTIQLGARIDATFRLGLTAHGFLQVDALVQFRPFHFVASVSAGFDVSAGGFKFAGVRLDGTISGPGPLVIRGSLTIETFLFDVSWDETFTIGSGPADTTPSPPRLIKVLEEELAKAQNLHAETMQDPAVVLEPRGTRPSFAAVPPTGTLAWKQRRAPLGLPIDRVDGQPLGSLQGVAIGTAGTLLPERFSPGSYCTLTSAEALNRPPFDILTCGVALSPAAAPAAPNKTDDRLVDVIVIVGGVRVGRNDGVRVDLGAVADLVAGSHAAPALSDKAPMVTATRETWATVEPGGAAATGHASATSAHQFARQRGSRAVAVADADAEAPVELAGV